MKKNICLIILAIICLFEMHHVEANGGGRGFHGRYGQRWCQKIYPKRYQGPDVPEQFISIKDWVKKKCAEAKAQGKKTLSIAELQAMMKEDKTLKRDWRTKAQKHCHELRRKRASDVVMKQHPNYKSSLYRTGSLKKTVDQAIDTEENTEVQAEYGQCIDRWRHRHGRGHGGGGRREGRGDHGPREGRGDGHGMRRMQGAPTNQPSASTAQQQMPQRDRGSRGGGHHGFGGEGHHGRGEGRRGQPQTPSAQPAPTPAAQQSATEQQMGRGGRRRDEGGRGGGRRFGGQNLGQSEKPWH